MKIKGLLSILLIMTLLAGLFTACGSKSLHTSGCRIIQEEDDYVTYQTVCDNCGYEYGDPTTAHVSSKLLYSVSCTKCDEIIYVRLERK